MKRSEGDTSHLDSVKPVPHGGLDPLRSPAAPRSFLVKEVFVLRVARDQSVTPTPLCDDKLEPL